MISYAVAGPTREFWEQRFIGGDTPWDRGAPSPQLGSWLRSGLLQPCRILVPGCGAGHELAVLCKAGFEVTGLDYSAAALALARKNLDAAGASATLVEADALAWQPAQPFDAIYEQTCLCALYPDQWRAYADQVFGWLVPEGMLYALFMQLLRPGAAEGSIIGPPYHCDVNAMRALFPAKRWRWPPPPYPRTSHPRGLSELAVLLQRSTKGES